MSTATITEAWLKRAELPDGVERLRVWDAALPGYGVVIGRRFTTFVARARVGGVRRDVTIGRHGAPGAGEHHGERWTEARARRRAMELLGAMSSGVDPVAAKATAASGPTLRDGLKMHTDRMAARRCSESSIETVEKGVNRYLGDWLDLPIASITGAMLIERHERIKKKAKARSGSNPRNPKGAPAANRTVAHFSAIWSTVNKKLEGKLGNWNPAKAVDKDALDPKREIVDDLPGWWTRVQSMETYPVGRDGLVVALFTGLRSEDVRTIRWEHVDLAARTLRLPDPKGGESRAFTIPICATVVEVLRRRQKENPARTGGDDRGWAFPTVDSDEQAMPITDLRQQLHGEDGHKRFPAEDVHTLRRTFISIAGANDVDVGEIDQRVLTNHAFAKRDVHELYVKQHIDHLRACVDKIEAGLKRRIGDTGKRRGKLRAV